jgi:hypothetical protein
LSGNIPITSIRNDLIKGLVNGFPTITISLRQTQMEISHPGLSMAACITTISG